MNVNAGVDEVHDEPLHLIGQQPGEVVQIVVPKVILKKKYLGQIIVPNVT